MFRPTSATNPIAGLCRYSVVVYVLLGLFLECVGCKPTVQKPGRSDVISSNITVQRPAPDGSEWLFETNQVLELHFTIPQAEFEQLQENPRKYVRAKFFDGTHSYAGVGVKLKGAAGSFREINDRPALTINVNKFKKGQSFHGLDKFHLNNSVQDESYACEWLCSDLFRSAGIPAARVSYARVWLNDRDLGLYVFKESFDARFIARYFHSNKGNLYDGGFIQDIDVDLEKDSGDGPDDHSDIQRLLEACRENDENKRFRDLEMLVDVPAFLKFFAMEQMTCHWDGYTSSANNYRLYFDPRTSKALFLPHGMDQMFGDPNFSIHNIPGTIVTQAILQNPKWRDQYFEVLKEILPRFSPATELLTKIDQLEARLQPVLSRMSSELAEANHQELEALRERVSSRGAELYEQIVNHKIPDPPEPDLSLVFNDQGIAEVVDWAVASETEAHHEVVDTEDGHHAYEITVPETNQPMIASWRRRGHLEAGRYRLEMLAKCEDVTPLEEGPGVGAGIRISGSTRERGLVGTQDWTLLEFECATEEDREVEFVAELRASQGRVWFDCGSIVLKRLESPEMEPAAVH